MREDIFIALNSISLGKHGILETIIVTPKVIKETIREFEK